MERTGRRGAVNRRVERAFDVSRLEQEYLAGAYEQILPEVVMRLGIREEATTRMSPASVDEPHLPAIPLRCA